MDILFEIRHSRLIVAGTEHVTSLNPQASFYGERRNYLDESYLFVIILSNYRGLIPWY